MSFGETRLPYPCFFRAILSSYGALLMGDGDTGPYCNDSVLAKETKLPRLVREGERACIVIRTWTSVETSVCSIVEFDDGTSSP